MQLLMASVRQCCNVLPNFTELLLLPAYRAR
jgi:hypothetical protein